MGAFPLQDLERALNKVSTASGASAAVSSALKQGERARQEIGKLPRFEFTSGFAAQGPTERALDAAVAAVKRAGEPYAGGGAQGVGGDWGGSLRPAISRLYGVLFDIFDRADNPPAVLSSMVADLGQSIIAYNDKKLAGKNLLEAAGTILGDVAHAAGQGVGAVGKGVGEGAGAASSGIGAGLWAIVKGAGPVLLVVAVVGGAGLAVYAFAGGAGKGLAAKVGA